MNLDLTKLKKETTNRPPRLVIYSAGGLGKSTFASQAPDVVFFDIEDGLDGIDAAKIKITTWQDVLDGITALHEQDHGFKTLAVDSIDWMERLIHDEVSKVAGVSNISEIGYGVGYTSALDYWSQFLQGMSSLRDNKGMTIILTAHDQIKRFEDPTGDGYDRHMLKLHQKAGDIVFEWADAVLFGKHKAAVIKEDAGFNKTVSKAKGLGRVLYTEDSPAYMAKHRASLALPAEIPLGWDSFIGAIGQRAEKK